MVAMEVSGTVSTILAQKSISVWSIGPNATVFDAIQLMADKNVGALPVVDGERLVGILSERDYTRKVILKGRSSRETPVSDIMTSDPKTASPNDAVSDCMRIMTETRVRHLPVIENGKMIGLVSIGDLVKWVISAQSATIDHLEKYIIGDYS
jgi:CBS domain-containing protein